MTSDDHTVACEHCGAEVPAGTLRPWVLYGDDDLRHLPRYSRTRELMICPDCYAAAREDERDAFGPSRRLTLVLGVLFVILLAATLIFPRMWTDLARYTYGASAKEQTFDRQHQDQNPTPWSGHRFSAPTDGGNGTSPPAPSKP